LSQIAFEQRFAGFSAMNWFHPLHKTKATEGVKEIPAKLKVLSEGANTDGSILYDAKFPFEFKRAHLNARITVGCYNLEQWRSLHSVFYLSIYGYY
jgi:hypothetical protein